MEGRWPAWVIRRGNAVGQHQPQAQSLQGLRGSRVEANAVASTGEQCDEAGERERDAVEQGLGETIISAVRELL